MTHVDLTIGGGRGVACLLSAALALGACGDGGGGGGGFCRAVADLEPDAAADLKALPDDAPAEVRDYFGATREAAALRKVWSCGCSRRRSPRPPAGRRSSDKIAAGATAERGTRPRAHRQRRRGPRAMDGRDAPRARRMRAGGE